jgi:hypothetical protein
MGFPNYFATIFYDWIESVSSLLSENSSGIAD